MEPLAAITLFTMFAAPIVGTVWVRHETRKQIGYTRDESWAEFEAEFGEVEDKGHSEVH